MLRENLTGSEKSCSKETCWILFDRAYFLGPWDVPGSQEHRSKDSVEGYNHVSCIFDLLPPTFIRHLLCA